MSITGRLSNNSKHIVDINADPTSTSTPAPIGSLAQWNNAGVGMLYLKTGSGNTAWTQVTAGGLSGTGTTGYVAYFNGTNSLTSEQYLSVVRGGVAADFSASTGFLQYASGVTSVAALTSGQITIALGYTPFNKAGDTLTGTGGAGFVGLNTQSSAPSAPATGTRLYSDASSNPAFVANSTTGGSFISTLNINGLSANRTFTLPDATGTVTLGTGTTNNMTYWGSTNAVTSGSASVTHSGALTVAGLITATTGVDNPSGTLAIGANATTINIGSAGATVNVLGSVEYVQTTNLQVADSLITLNKGGTTGSATASGIEIEENSAITAYLKTANSRASFDMKAPASSGVMRFTPTTAAFTGELAMATLTAGRTWTFPDTTGTVALTNTVTMQNTYNNSTSPQIVLTSGLGGLAIQDNATPIAASLFSVSSNGASSSYLDVRSGGVGIGVANPSQRLQVRGSILQDTSAGVNKRESQANVDTTDATITALVTEATVSNAIYYVRATVMARRTGGSGGTANDTSVFQRWAMFKNTAGTVTLLQFVTPDTYTDVATTDASWAVSSTNMVLNVTGVAATNYSFWTTYTVERIS